jgi:hypothetical protein
MASKGAFTLAAESQPLAIILANTYIIFKYTHSYALATRSIISKLLDKCFDLHQICICKYRAVAN